MRIACHSSNIGSDVRCAVCGQGFLIYAGTRASFAEIREDVQRALRHHHEHGIHPSGEFHVEVQSDATVLTIA